MPFDGYTMPAAATDFDLGAHFESRGNISTQRNTATVNWTSGKWYKIGFRWLADYSDIEEWGLWVGDLDDLTSYSWLPFNTSLFDPTAASGFSSFVGLTSFEGTNFAAVGAVRGANGIDHLLLNLTTGQFVASATASAAAISGNVQNFPFILPTSTVNVFHKFDLAKTASAGTSRWAVIEYNLAAPSVTVLVNYVLVPAGLQDITEDVACKGQELASSNTVFCINMEADNGKIFEVTIPHNTTAAVDLSFAELVTVAGITSGEAVVGIYYDAGLDRVVYTYRLLVGGAEPWFINYEAVAREAPSTVLWTHEVAGTVPAFSRLSYSSYQHVRVTGCTAIDTEERNVIDIQTGTITKYNQIYTSASQIIFDIHDLQSDRAWSTFKDYAATANSVYATNDFVFPDPDVPFVIAWRAPLSFGYPDGACAAEAGSNWQNVCFLNPIERVT